MIRRLAKRLVASGILLFMVSVLSFYLIVLAPGEALPGADSNPRISAQTLEALRRRSDLELPAHQRYLHWVAELIHGSAGYSYVYDAPVLSLIWPRLGNTLILSGTAYLFAWLLGVPLGIAAAVTRRNWLRKSIQALASVAISLPRILLALIAILIAARTGWLPLGGMTALDHDQLGFAGRSADSLEHLLFPALVLSLYPMALYLMQSKEAISEALRGDYVRTARAKGLPESAIIYRHVFRNAANPLITLLGFSIGDLLGGAVLVETIMSWPGLGKLTVEAVFARDAYVVLTSVLLSSALLIGGNLLAEFVMVRVDPRVRSST